MIKVDVISGFLGAGKTTLIRQLADVLTRNQEKIVIVENEFGEIGVDGKMLESAGLTVYEISSGCICCSLRNDFVTTVMEITDKIKTDRIIIEPSGIFMLSGIFDIFQNPTVKSRCVLNQIITVVDSLNYLDQRHKYTYFFQNQIRHSYKLILSKTENLDPDTLALIIEELQMINPFAEICAAPWSGMSDDDFLMLLDDNVESGVVEKASEISTTPSHTDHKSFVGLGIRPDGHFTETSLKEKLERISGGAFGDVLRAKGYVNSVNGSIEFNYVCGRYDIVTLDRKIEPSICFIGENLEKSGLNELFDS